jgi:hypothetical protein
MLAPGFLQPWFPISSDSTNAGSIDSFSFRVLGMAIQPSCFLVALVVFLLSESRLF